MLNQISDIKMSIEEIFNKFWKSIQNELLPWYNDDILALKDIIIKQAPESPYANFCRGWMELDEEKKINYYNRAIEIKDDLWQTFHFRGVAYETLGKNDLALSDFNMLIKLKPKYFAGYSCRASIFYKLKKYELAFKDYEYLILNVSENSDFIAGRGACKHELDDYEGALKDFSKAIELNSEYPGAFFYRGICKINLKKYEDGLSDLEKAHHLGFNIEKFIEEFKTHSDKDQILPLKAHDKDLIMDGKYIFVNENG
jgi:tetratricopeptide (TPR) repeat protein